MQGGMNMQGYQEFGSTQYIDRRYTHNSIRARVFIKYPAPAQYTCRLNSTHLLLVFLVHINHLLHLLLTSQEDTTPVVNMLRHNLHHALHLTVNRETTRCTSLA